MCLRALVVSAHAVVRSALLSMLDREPGVVSWAEDTTPEDGAADPREDIPNVVLFECGRLDDVAIQRIHELGSRYAGAHVLVLTSSGAQEAMRQALEAGVSGFLLESASRADLMNAMHAVARGGLFVRHEHLRSWLQREPPSRGAPPVKGNGLTPREVEVLRLIVAGYTNPSIAQRLCISVRTVEFHRRNIREKLDVKGRAELVRYALHHGLMATVAADAPG